MRISWPVRRSARRGLPIGRDKGADYVVMGSLSEFGETLSADVRILDIRQGKRMPPLFIQGRGRTQIEKLAGEVKSAILLKIAPEQRIAGVEIQGNRKIGASAIEQVLKSRKGGLFSEGDITADIKAIYRMGYFSNVSAEVTDSPDGRFSSSLCWKKP